MLCRPRTRFCSDKLLGGLARQSRHVNIQPGDPVKVLIRPDDIIHQDSSELTAKVVARHFRGAEFLYHLELDNHERVLALVPSHHDHAINERIGIRLEIDHVVVFK